MEVQNGVVQLPSNSKSSLFLLLASNEITPSISESNVTGKNNGLIDEEPKLIQHANNLKLLIVHEYHGLQGSKLIVWTLEASAPST